MSRSKSHLDDEDEDEDGSEAEERRERAVREAFGQIDVAGQTLDFNIAINAVKIGRRGWDSVGPPSPPEAYEDGRDWHRAKEEAFAAAVERSMARVAPDIKWRGPRHGPFDTGGPGEDIIAIALTTGAIFWAATQAASMFNTWVEFGRNLRSALPRVKEEFDAEPHVASGTAMLLGAAALRDESDHDDFSFAFSASMSAHPANDWPVHDGFAVGFRSTDAIRVVVIDLNGDARAIMHADLPGTLPAWWNQ